MLLTLQWHFGARTGLTHLRNFFVTVAVSHRVYVVNFPKSQQVFIVQVSNLFTFISIWIVLCCGMSPYLELEVSTHTSWPPALTPPDLRHPHRLTSCTHTSWPPAPTPSDLLHPHPLTSCTHTPWPTAPVHPHPLTSCWGPQQFKKKHLLPLSLEVYILHPYESKIQIMANLFMH